MLKIKLPTFKQSMIIIGKTLALGVTFYLASEAIAFIPGANLNYSIEFPSEKIISHQAPKYHISITSVRAGDQTSQASFQLKVGHSAILLTKTEFDGKVSYTTLSTKGGHLGDFWVVDNDEPILIKFKKAQALKVLSFEGLSIYTQEISESKYLSLIPVSKGGQTQNYQGLGGCHFYFMTPFLGYDSSLCNCSTGVIRVFKIATGNTFDSKNPTMLSQKIDSFNRDPYWLKGKTGNFLPARFGLIE